MNEPSLSQRKAISSDAYLCKRKSFAEIHNGPYNFHISHPFYTTFVNIWYYQRIW